MNDLVGHLVAISEIKNPEVKSSLCEVWILSLTINQLNTIIKLLAPLMKNQSNFDYINDALASEYRMLKLKLIMLFFESSYTFSNKDVIAMSIMEKHK